MGCATEQHHSAKARPKIAAAMFQERCKEAGEKIYKTVKDVDGVFLVNLRPIDTNFSSQYGTVDPYGRDLQGDGYIETFLRGAFQASYRLPKVLPVDFPAHLGYSYVEAVDPADGKRYRYTGVIERPGLTDTRYSIDTENFVIRRSLADGMPPQYGVKYTDISTLYERSYWIAGSSLQVIDMSSGEVIAERIGYLVDIAQGSTGGGRMPWLWAANHSCPSFGTVNAFSAQPYQTESFVAKVLHPRALK